MPSSMKVMKTMKAQVMKVSKTSKPLDKAIKGAKAMKKEAKAMKGSKPMKKPAHTMQPKWLLHNLAQKCASKDCPSVWPSMVYQLSRGGSPSAQLTIARSVASCRFAVGKRFGLFFWVEFLKQCF